ACPTAKEGRGLSKLGVAIHVRKQKRRPCGTAFLANTFLSNKKLSDGRLQHQLRVVRAYEPACGPGGLPRPSGAPSFRKASRNSCAASSRETHLRAATSSSAPEAPDRHCYRERPLARGTPARSVRTPGRNETPKAHGIRAPTR